LGYIEVANQSTTKDILAQPAGEAVSKGLFFFNIETTLER
jgi:hypothetical protein